MHITRYVPVALCAFLWAQQPPSGKTLTARELFYAAAEQPAAKAAVTAARPEPKPSQPVPKKKAAHVRRPAAPASPPVDPEPVKPPRVPAGNTVSDPGELIRPVSHVSTPGGGLPLGLRYTLLKLTDGRMLETAPDAVFHAGDRIQLTVEANDSGYLYIVHQGSSGAWKPMFPSQEIEDGNNRVERGRSYVLPPGSRFYFDDQPGEERLFVVLSRQPEPDLEKLIYSLQGGAPAPTADPAPAPAPPKRLLLAANLPIDNALVGRLRNVYARDLVIEKVDEETPGPRREKAVYVVNATGNADSRVVADIRLQHK